MGRPSNKAQRRQEIAFALLTVMSETGYEAASVQSISKEAGLSSGLVHYHFKNKLEILTEAIHLLVGHAEKRYEAKKENATNAGEALEAYIDAALALGERASTNMVASWVAIGAEAIRQPDIKVQYQTIVKKQLDELMSLMTNYCEENSLSYDADVIHHLASMTIASIEGAYQLASTADEITPKNYAADTLKKMVFGVLQG